MGKTSALDHGLALIKDGHRLSAIATQDDLGARAVAVHGRSLQQLQFQQSLANNTRAKKKPPKVFWLYGPTGIGKSLHAWNFAERAFGPAEIYSCPCPELKWHDGYFQHKVVIYEDFRAKNVDFRHLLRLLDRYPVMVSLKGAFMAYLPELILITTPLSPKETFAKRYEHIPEDINQLERRLIGSFNLSHTADKKNFRAERENFMVTKKTLPNAGVTTPKPITPPPATPLTADLENCAPTAQTIRTQLSDLLRARRAQFEKTTVRTPSTTGGIGGPQPKRGRR